MDKKTLDIFIKELEGLCKSCDAWYTISKDMKPDLKSIRVEISVKIK